MDEVVKLESIGEAVEHLGQRTNFFLKSIQKESEQFILFISNCLKKYEKDIEAFQYDFSEKEVSKIAEISRNACDYYDNGVFLLFLYFTKAIRNLESKGKKVEQIEQLMEDSLNKITKKYPPGEGLSKDKKYIEPQLKSLDMEEKFEHKSQKFTSSDKKS